MQKWAIPVLAAALLLAGCCNNPGGLATARGVISAVQTFYDPLLGIYLDDRTNEMAALAMVSADTALSLAGAIQAGYCASQAEAEQLKLQAAQADRLAAAAGVN
jgi:hypothetical protein